MAPGTPRRRYTITELLVMGKTLPYVCCPVKSFKPEAWTEKILNIAVPTNNLISPNEKLRLKILTARLEFHRPHEPTNHQETIVKKRKPQIRGAPPKPRVMPTIPEMPSPPSIPTGLSGGYGKKIETDASSSSSGNGLIASMYAFVPGGTLKTVPVTAVDAGDGGGWGAKENTIGRRVSTLSLADGLGVVDKVSVTAAPTTTKARVPLGDKVENVKNTVVVETTGKARVEVTKPVMERPKALMARNSNNTDQVAWIEYMKKQRISASREAPYTKEALGASIEDISGRERFKALDEFHEGNITAGRPW